MILFLFHQFQLHFIHSDYENNRVDGRHFLKKSAVPFMSGGKFTILIEGAARSLSYTLFVFNDVIKDPFEPQ